MELYLYQKIVVKIVLTTRMRRNLRRLMNSGSLETEGTGLEERLRSAESGNKLALWQLILGWDVPFVADRDHLSIGKLVALLQR